MDKKPLRVLLVEDNPGDARLIREMMAEVKDETFALEWVERLSLALEHLARGGIDVVLLDLLLPDSRGLDTFLSLQTKVFGVPVVIITGLSDERLGVRAVQRGAEDYLVKGQADSNLLTRALRYAVERHRLTTELKRYDSSLERMVKERTAELVTANERLCQEITERQKTEMALREMEERLLSLFQTMAEGVVLIDANGQIIEANPATERILGLSRAEIKGRHYASPDWQVLRPNGTPMPPEELLPYQAVKEKRLLKDQELGFKRPDGSICWLEISAAPLISEDGKLGGVVVTFSDITERRKMHEQLMITDRLASLGELASGIAHEINNPLTSVIAFSQLILEKDIPDEVKADLNIVCREAQCAAGVIKNLLTFARRHSLVREPVPINSLLEKVLELRAYEQKVNNIQVINHFAPDLPEIMADYFQLQQVFFNLIVNAEYFVTQAHGRGTLMITTEGVGAFVRVSLADDGPGIPQENLGHIFDPFFTTKEAGKGTGLGLSICHKIVTGHGGHLYCESELGKGATFLVELPTGNY